MTKCINEHQATTYACPNCGTVNCFGCCISVVLVGCSSIGYGSSCMTCRNCYTNYDIPSLESMVLEKAKDPVKGTCGGCGQKVNKDTDICATCEGDIETQAFAAMEHDMLQEEIRNHGLFEFLKRRLKESKGLIAVASPPYVYSQDIAEDCHCTIGDVLEVVRQEGITIEI